MPFFTRRFSFVLLIAALFVSVSPASSAQAPSVPPVALELTALSQPLPDAPEEDQAFDACLHDLATSSPTPLRTVARIANLRIVRFHGPLTIAQALENLAFLLNHGVLKEG